MFNRRRILAAISLLFGGSVSVFAQRRKSGPPDDGEDILLGRKTREVCPVCGDDAPQKDHRIDGLVFKVCRECGTFYEKVKR